LTGIKGITGVLGATGPQGLTGIVGDTVAHVIQFITGGYLYGGAKSTFGATGAGWFLGDDTSDLHIHKFHIGDGAQYLKYSPALGMLMTGDYKTSATVGTTKGVHLDVANNELYFYGDIGDGTIEKLVSIGGATTNDPLVVLGSSENSHKTSIEAHNKRIDAHAGGDTYGFTNETLCEITSGSHTLGNIYGFKQYIMRGDVSCSSDTNTLLSLTGIQLQYGHNTYGTTPDTGAIVGLNIQPYHKEGTIGTSYGILLNNAATGITPTNYYAIYQLDAAAKNYWAGYHLAKGGIRVGTTDTDPGDNNLYVEGTFHVDGVATLASVVSEGNITGSGLTASLPVFTDTNKILASKSVADTRTALGLGTADNPTFAAPVLTSFKASGAEQLKIWTYTHTVSAQDITDGHIHITISAISLAKVRDLSFAYQDTDAAVVYDEYQASGNALVSAFYIESTTSVFVSFQPVAAATDIVSITIIEAV
jgi:hypothetical protein